MQKDEFSFDVHKICRLCLQELQDGSFIGLFNINLPVSPLVMISRCATIEVYEKDGFPQAICNGCYYKLEMAFEFRNRCESSDQKLREFLNIPASNSKNELLLSMNERTDANKEDDIYAAMSDIFGPEDEPPTVITPQTLGSILEEATKETPKSSATTVKPAKVKLKQIKRKSQLDELLVKHKEKLWLESTKVKIIRTKRKQSLFGRKRGTLQNEANQQLQRLKSGPESSPLECQICQRRFNRSSNLRLHLRIHSNERRFQCEVCSKQFRTSSNLHAHLKTHTDERNYPCTVCDRAFRTSRELVNHGKTHSDVKNYVCRLCSKAFVKQSYLNTHMNTVHVGVKRYRCQECGKQFSNSSNLIAHRRVHTGEKPYQCGECDSKFNQSSALTRHMRQQHRPKEPSPEPPPTLPPATINRESEPEELSIEVDENRSLESAASSELSVATSLMDSQSFSYGGMPYAQTFVPQPPPPPPQPTSQHFSHVAHQHHHLHHTHLAPPPQQHHPYHRHHHHHQQQHHHPHHHPHHHQHTQPPPPSIIHHQSMAVNQQMAGANLYSSEYLPPYHSTGLPSTQQTHYELGGYDMCYSMPASTVLNPSLMNPQPTYIFDQ
uniref:Protein krueppel n=1 Tax=Anopheles farauti TaxID=69004 RepID=A0A182QP42_9DIPT